MNVPQAPSWSSVRETSAARGQCFPARHAFVDAYGDPGLQVERDATTAAFIVAAVIVDDERLVSAREEAEKVRKSFFGQGPIKSKKVGDDDERRLEILSRLAALPFTFAAVALDKARTWRDEELLYPGLRLLPPLQF